MNNNYDREPTHDERKADGMAMTADGFWIPVENFSEEELLELGNTAPALRLLLLKSGETIVSQVRGSMCGTKLTLENPRTVSIEAVGKNSSTVKFSDWMPLAQHRTFDISADYVVTSVEPLDSLFKSYSEN